MEDEVFSLKMHELMVSLLAATAREKGKTAFSLPVRRVASVYAFEDSLKDAEEVDFCMDEIFFELAELTLRMKDGDQVIEIPQCGIVSMEYPGDGRFVHFEVVPGLVNLKEFELAEASAEDEE